jgi:hypothetical protein
MKTLKQIKEATGGLGKAYLNPSELREIKRVLNAMSVRLFTTMDEAFKKIEKVLNNYGYTLGLPDELEIENSGEEQFYIMTFANGSFVKNAYIIFSWEKNNNPQQDAFNAYKSLNFSINVEIVESDQDELEDMFDDLKDLETDSNDDGTEDYENIGEPSDDESNVDEMFRIREINRKVTFFSDDSTMEIEATPNGSIIFKIGSSEFIVNKLKTDEVMETIQELYIKFLA